MADMSFLDALNGLKDTGAFQSPDLVYISIPNPKERLLEGLMALTGDAAVWQPEYDEILKWMSNNKGRGLLCFGTCGRGKTLICGRILPVIINTVHRKIVSCFDAQQMNAKIDFVKEKHIIYLDDIGTESISVKFGEKRLAFPELVDEAEKKGKLLIVTTNLSISELQEKYGVRTVDRLKAITMPIVFKGESLRK